MVVGASTSFTGKGVGTPTTPTRAARSGRPSQTDHRHTRNTRNIEHMATATTTPSTATELTAILVNSGMDAEEALKVSTACSDATIGITTIVSVLGFDAGSLANIGTSDFTTAMKTLIAKVKALDGSCLTTVAQEGQFTSAVRKCAKEGAAQEGAQLRAIGLGAPAPSNTVVLGNEGEAVIKREEVERRRNLDAAIGGYWHLPDATPSTKMVSFFAKGLAESPPILRLFPLGSACSDFNARQTKKPMTGLERFAGEPEDQFDMRGDNPNSKGRFVHALILVGNAIAIAASELIPTAKQKDYHDLPSGQVQHRGGTAYVYGTRYITEVMMMAALVEGAKSEPDQLTAGYMAVMKTASRYVGARYLLNGAFAKAVHEEKGEWRSTRTPLYKEPKVPRLTGGGGGGGGGGTSGTSVKKQQIDTAKNYAKNKMCGDFNRDNCTRPRCNYEHKCSALIMRDGKFELCGAHDHSRKKHVELCKTGEAPAIQG